MEQQCGSSCPTLPDSDRLVLLEERHGAATHVGWYSHCSGWWLTLSRETVSGEKLPHGAYCSITIGHITNWRELTHGWREPCDRVPMPPHDS